MGRRVKAAEAVLAAMQEEGKVLSYQEYKKAHKSGRVRADRVKAVWGSWRRMEHYLQETHGEDLAALGTPEDKAALQAKIDSATGAEAVLLGSTENAAVTAAEKAAAVLAELTAKTTKK